MQMRRRSSNDRSMTSTFLSSYVSPLVPSATLRFYWVVYISSVVLASILAYYLGQWVTLIKQEHWDNLLDSDLHVSFTNPTLSVAHRHTTTTALESETNNNDNSHNNNNNNDSDSNSNSDSDNDSDSDSNNDDNIEWIETLSWEPRLSLYHNILTKEECEYIIELGEKEFLSRSEVVDEQKINPGRTSSGTFLKNYRTDQVISKLEKKIAVWTHIPRSHGEIFYLLKYDVGQEYKPHYDYFTEKDLGIPGNRIASVLIYLKSSEEGGETIFPQAQPNPIKVAPKQGNAVLFWNSTPDGLNDPKSLHGSLPVIKGTKWALTKWLRAGRRY